MDKLTQALFTAFTIFALVAFALGPREAEAQNEAGQVFLGVQGGLTQSSFTGSGSDASGRQGYGGGAHVMYNVNEAFSVQMDFLFSQRGAEEVTADAGQNVSDAYNLDGSEIELQYYEFPLLFKVTAPIEQVKVRAMAGPAISFQTGAEIDGEETQRQLESTPKVQNRFLLYDVFGVVGGELALPLPGLGNGEVALDGRYQVGLKNVEQTQEMELKNRSFSGSLILRFGI